jgi:outer membrane protein assembly factor BamA
MWRRAIFPPSAALALLTLFAHAECVEDHRSSKTSGVLITDLAITGTHTLSSSELASFASKLTGSCFDESEDELGERIRSLFQDKGFFEVLVENLRIKTNDPLLLPRPVSVEVNVTEGRRFTIGDIKFAGNHAFTTSELRDKFLLKKGDLFVRSKIGAGLEGVRNLYTSDGFVDFTAVPDVEKSSDGSIILAITIVEGRQYRMGKLEIFAKKEQADRLRSQWEMHEGSVFDQTYIERFIEKNRTLLPAEFNEQNAQVVRDCRKASVEIRLPLDGTDPRSQVLPKEIDCESAGDATQ